MYPLRGPKPWFSGLIAALLLAMSRHSVAYDLDPDSPDSIKSIAKNMADDMLSFYHGDEPGQIPGLLPNPYYWWEAGAMLGALVDYWYYTDDDEYVPLTKQGLLFQVGKNNDYMPINQTRTEGNDDQGFWGLAVMSAAEYNFPEPEPDEPQWLALAQAVFNTQAARWDDHCGGGLRWQIFQWNNGYTYKNSISQACFFALGARLALFTGNNTYADWADKTWDWMIDINFINQKSWYVYDGAHIETNCTNIVPYQFSYNAGGFILGAAAMYNYTESPVWKERLDNLLEGVKVFFTGPNKDIMTEVACEPVDLCNIDQQSFKAYLSRWLAACTQWAPHTTEILMPYLRASAIAAAKQCVGGDNGRMCGLIWNEDKYDGSTGVGQQMAAMEVTLSTMIQSRSAPYRADTGGTSKGDPAGGSEDIGRTEPEHDWRPMTAGDRAGGAILTIVVLGTFFTGLVWMLLDETSEKGPVGQFKDFSSQTGATITALAAGGGIAAVMHRNRSDRTIDEKTGAAVIATSDSSRPSSTNQVSAVAPVHIGHVRNQSEMQHRRVSSMPIGWPRNPAVRSSAAFDPDGIHSIPGHHSRSNSTNHAFDEHKSEPMTSQVPLPEDTPINNTETQNRRPSQTIGSAY